MGKITPFLWFNHNAEEAVNFYTSIFKNSKINHIRYYPEGSPSSTGTVMALEFELEAQAFIALNGGPQFTFSPAISFFVNCQSQHEVDELWTQLSAGGTPQQCGWLQDKYGVSWQIIPQQLGELLQSSDAQKSQRVMAKMLTMEKLNIDALVQASEHP